MTTKTQRELNLEYWGRVHDMCDSYNKEHGTNIKPQQCVKLNGNLWNLNEHLMFDGTEYDLASAIIEDTPVFVGDKIYSKITGGETTVPHGNTYISQGGWTLTPPKPQRTFELNGQQLPCPSNESDNYRIYLLDLLGEYYYFDSIDDRNKVAKALINLLDDARDKD